MRDRMKKLYDEVICELAIQMGPNIECPDCKGTGEVEYTIPYPNPPFGEIQYEVHKVACGCSLKLAEKEFLLWIAEEKFAQIWGEMEEEKRAM